MPKTVAVAEVPAIVRTVAESKWARFATWTREHFLDEKRRDAQAIVFNVDDGVTEENWGKVLQSCRNAGKALGFRVRGRWLASEGLLYVQSDGPFVARGARAVASEKNGSTASTTSAANRSSAKTGSGARK